MYIKKTENTKCEQGYGETGRLVLCWCIYKRYSCYIENGVVVPQKNEDTIIMRSSNSTFGYVPQTMGFKHIFVHHVHSNIGNSHRK
jgi:hypothetical protein